MSDGQGRRWRVFAVLGLVAAAAVIVAVLLQRQRMSAVAPPTAAAPTMPGLDTPGEIRAQDSPPGAGVPAGAPGVQVAPSAQAPPEQSVAKARIFYRYTGLDQNYGRLAFQDGPAGRRQIAGTLSCDVAYVAGGHGLCLSAKRGVITTYSARVFDASTFEVAASFPLAGMPSRTRVSLDGKLAAYTVFLTGHGYTTLDFSTQTVLVDLASAKQLMDLEQDFTVFRDGAQIKGQDFNFWGVTFTADAKRFYATLSTGGKHFLVTGDIVAKTMTVVHENVECPSLSPDGSRVAYKKRFLEGGRIYWQLQVLDLATGKETALAERRSIDDQLEWLDVGHLLYSVPQADQDAGGGTDVWVAAADGSGKPKLFLRRAYSPSVTR